MKIMKRIVWVLCGLSLMIIQSALIAQSGELLKLKGYYFASQIPEFKGNPDKGAVFNNPEFYLHGFHLDYTKLKPMFEYGLLSVEELEKRGIIASITHGGVTADGKITGMCNGRNQISLSSVRLMNEREPCYAIKDAITLVVQGIELGEKHSMGCSMGEQEVRVDAMVPPEYFAGIIIPLNVLTQTIDKISFMTGYDIEAVDGEVYTTFLSSKVKHLQQDLDVEDPELAYMLGVLQDSRFSVSGKGFEFMVTRINEAIRRGFEKKFNRPQRLITFWDVIKSMIPEDFPIYDANGDLIEDIWQKEGYELLVPEITLPEGW